MNVVLYMRYSSDRQTEQSIEGQERVCTAFCEAQGYTIVEKYIDRATSAYHDTDKRIEFQRMIADSEKHNFQAVVVYKLDRFARNRYDSATIKARLKKNGVRVISATENISDNPEGVLLESVLEGMAEFYSKELSQKIQRGMNESALKCNSCGGRLPLGYKVVDKKFVIDPVTSEYVRTAFRMYADGHTSADIYNYFNKKKWKTSSGAAFNKSSFRRMLRNEKYIGIYKYNNVRVENGIPAIIDRDLWDAVQVRLDERANAPAANRNIEVVDYMLSGKLFCGRCNSSMTGIAGTGKRGHRYYYYGCTGKKKHECSMKPIPKEWIERTVAEETMRLFSKEFIESLAEDIVAENEKEIHFNTRIPALQIRLKDLEKSISNLLRLVESGAESSSLAVRLTELEKEKRAVTKELLTEKNSIVPMSKDMIVFFLEQFLGDNPDDLDCRRHILDMLVQSVYVYEYPDKPTELEIGFNVTPYRKSKITMQDRKESVEVSSLSTIAPPNALKTNTFYNVRKKIVLFKALIEIPNRV